MKKYIIYLFTGLLFASCNDWLDVNKDPNTPSEVPPGMILPAAEASIAVRMGGTMFNYTGFFVQYWAQAPEANQYNDLETNSIPNSFADNDYQEIYASALYDLETVRKVATASNDKGGYLAATVLRAFAFQNFVDLFDKVPYTEALLGAANTMPVWDDGAAVYDGLLQELDEAITNYDGGAVYQTDLIFHGNTSQWIGFANALKLRIMMRASFATDKYNQKIIDLVNRNEFFKGNVTFTSFSDESGKRNPWYETNRVGLSANNHIATYDIIKTLEAYSDPRLPVIWTKNVTGEYAGNYPGTKTRSGIKTNQFSFPVMTAKTPVYLYTQTELQLFIAEAKLRFMNDDSGAKAAYDAAVTAGLAIHGLEVPAGLLSGSSAYAWKSTGSQEEKLEQIGIAKWINLCMVNHLESWNEVRRLGYPKAVATSNEVISNPTAYTAGQLMYPAGNLLGEKALMNRLPYPNVAIIRNTNTPKNPEDQKWLGTSVIWWDKR